MPEPVLEPTPEALVHLFVGPSAFGVDTEAWRRQGVALWPPVRRGDVVALVQFATTPGVLVVCDGVFHGEPAVSHAELCQAIDAGWQVWGVSSMGAIRAYELRHEGMSGFGEVYRFFEQLPGYTDDELCLLHFPEPPYFPVTEALVNVRHGLATQGPALGLSPDAAQAVLQRLGAVWFGERSDTLVRDALLHDGRLSAAQADALLAWIGRNRIKTLDLCRLMACRPWAQPPLKPA